jgi:hypothetical protein
MEMSSNGSSDVLHAANPNKLSAEEIAKAVARHNRHHSHQVKAGAASGKQISGKR